MGNQGRYQFMGARLISCNGFPFEYDRWEKGQAVFTINSRKIQGLCMTWVDSSREIVAVEKRLLCREFGSPRCIGPRCSIAFGRNSGHDFQGWLKGCRNCLLESDKGRTSCWSVGRWRPKANSSEFPHLLVNYTKRMKSVHHTCVESCCVVTLWRGKP